MLKTVIKFQNQVSMLSCRSKSFVPNLPLSFKKSSLTAHNFKTGGVSLVFFRVDNFSQLHRNLMCSPYEGETPVRSI